MQNEFDEGKRISSRGNPLGFLEERTFLWISSPDELSIESLKSHFGRLS